MESGWLCVSSNFSFLGNSFLCDDEMGKHTVGSCLSDFAGFLGKIDFVASAGISCGRYACHSDSAFGKKSENTALAGSGFLDG